MEIFLVGPNLCIETLLVCWQPTVWMTGHWAFTNETVSGWRSNPRLTDWIETGPTRRTGATIFSLRAKAPITGELTESVKERTIRCCENLVLERTCSTGGIKVRRERIAGAFSAALFLSPLSLFAYLEYVRNVYYIHIFSMYYRSEEKTTFFFRESSHLSDCGWPCLCVYGDIILIK